MTKDEDKKQDVNFTLDPNKTPVYAVDGYLIGSDANYLKINFAQASMDGAQQNIISRISMTTAQAREFAATLTDHIEKFEV